MRTIDNFINFLNPAAPKGLIASSESWVRQARELRGQLRRPQPVAYAREAFPAEENLRIVQQSGPAPVSSEFHNVRWSLSESATLFYLQNCRIMGREGAVISSDNRLFCEFTLPPAESWLDHSCFRRRRIPKVEALAGWYATVALPESEFFFHWMIESLPRMALLADYISVLDGVFVAGQLQSFHVESLGILGVPREKLITLDAQSHFLPEHLFVPKAFAMYNVPKWVIAWYRSTFAAHAPSLLPAVSKQRRIYISRNDAPARKIANETAVMVSLAARGFEVFELSNMSFAQQVELFSSADVIVAGHGAGLSNIVFCKPEAKIVEVLPPNWMAPCFMSLASVAKCEYRFVEGRTAQPALGLPPQRADIDIPITALNEVLDELL